MKTKGLFYGLLCSLLLLLSMTGRVSADTPVSGMICSDTTWTLAGNPYIVTGNVVVCSGATLTIEPDVTVKFDSGRALQIDGTLIASGTGSSNITFTSNQSTPAPGDWGYILFSDSSTDATYDTGGNYTGGSILEYAVIEYAGGTSVSNNGAVRMDNAHPLVNYCTIRNNNASGIMAYNLTGTLKITNSAINNNSSGTHPDFITGGIAVSGGTVIITNNTLDNNNTGISLANLLATISGNTVSNNKGLIGVRIVGGEVTINNNTIRDNEFNMGCSAGGRGGGIDICGGSCNGLGGGTVLITNNTIINNNTLTCWSKGGGINNMGGTVTIQNNIIANNTAQTSGGGISSGGYFGGLATILNNVIINNTSLNSGGGGVSCQGGCEQIKNNSIIGNSAPNGAAIVYNDEANQNFAFNTVKDNRTTGISPNSTVYIDIGSYPIITYNHIFNNTATYELWNDNPQGSAVVNAENNWWGTTDEAQIEDKIYHWMDDASKGFVDYTPYLYAPIGPGDNLWNLRSNADDRFNDNTPWLRPWRYDYEDGWGRWVGEWSYEVQWGEKYTQGTGSAGGINWNTDADGNLHLTGGQDHQWHVWTYVYAISPKSITIPATCDCVPRAFLNYDFDNPIAFPATLNLQTGWNRIDITGYNQNSGYAFDLNYPLAENVDAMGSKKLFNDAPISPPTGLVATPGPGIITMSWSPNPEPDTAGYRVYWDTDPDYPYANVVDVGNVTSYVIDGLPLNTYYVTVTAYDTAYNPANDDPATIVNENQTNGNESWFAVEKTVTEPHTLTVYKAGSGGGTVTSLPAGIDCGSDCDAVYNTCEEVTLTATQDAGSTFAGWGGDCSGTTPSTTLSMCSDKTCTATFLIDTDGDGVPDTSDNCPTTSNPIASDSTDPDYAICADGVSSNIGSQCDVDSDGIGDACDPAPLGICGGRPVTILGTAGDNIISGTIGPDVIKCLGGNDIVVSFSGYDVICGGPGNDILIGGDGVDRLLGEGGNDYLFGGNGNDRLPGGGGNDTIYGEAGDDILYGNAGDDNLDGGIGIDTCDGGPHKNGDTATNCETVTNVP